MRVMSYTALMLASTCISTGALAQTATVAAVSQTPEIVVTATGVTRKELAGGLMVVEKAPKAVSTVTQDFIQKQSSSADVFQLLKLVPGATAATADAYGLNQGVISVRGVDGTQMGFNFEGMPLNDQANWSVFPGEWIDTENTKYVNLEQGAADLSSVDVNATGGVVNLFLHDPQHRRGGLIDASIGSNNAKRFFLRLESGEIGDTGIRGFISASTITADHFRGVGRDRRSQTDFGVVKDWDDGSTIKLALTYTWITRDTYKNPTLAQWLAPGGKGGLNGTMTNWDPITTAQVKNPFRNLLLSVPAKKVFNENLNVELTPYLYYGYGDSGSAQPFNENKLYFGAQKVSPIDLNGNGTTTDSSVWVYNPIFEDNTRLGVIAKVNYTLGANKFVAGGWYQWSKDLLYRPYSRTNANGTPINFNGETNLIYYNGQVIQGWYQDTRDKFYGLFIGDTITFSDKLSVDLGVKQAWVERLGINRVPSPFTRSEADRSNTLPTAAVRYNLDEKNEVYATVATGYRTLPAGALYPRYGASTGAVTTAPNPHQPSETSVSEELGYRFNGDLLALSASAFHYHFKNRQISAMVCDPGCVTAPINGGEQSASGMDFEAGLKPLHNFRPYVSAEYLDTQIDSNIPVSGDFLPTKGKEAVRAPKWQAAAALDYDNGYVFGGLTAKYVGEQFATFMNDQKIPSYTTVDMTMGFRLKDIGLLKKPEFRLNLLNVTNEHYLSGVNSPTTNSVATKGVDGTTIAASQPSYLIASGFTALFTVVTAF